MASTGTSAGWSTFGADPSVSPSCHSAGSGAVEATSLEDKCEECSIDFLLDSENLVEEYRAGNAHVHDRFNSPSAVRTLLEYVTKEPPEGVPEQSCRRRPYVAAELLACSTERLFSEAFNEPGCTDELLSLLWVFLDSDPTRAAAPVLAGYFCSTAASLLSWRHAEVVEHLRRCNPERLLERFLAWLELRCCAELLALMLCAEAPAQLIFPLDGFVAHLVARLKGDGLPGVGAAHEHAAFLLDSLLARACVGELCCGDEFLHQFAAPNIVAALVDQVFAGGHPASENERDDQLSGPCVAATMAAAAAAATTLKSAVIHLHLLPPNPLLPARSLEHHPPSPPAASQQDYSIEDVDRRKLTERLETAGANLVTELCKHFPRICGVLEAVVDRCQASSNARAGAAAVEVVCLFALLAKTNRPIVFEAMLSAAVLPHCLEVFFACAWNNILHNAVWAVFLEIFCNLDQGLQVLLALLADDRLMRRIIDEHLREAEAREDTASDISNRRRRVQVGYMGHLRRICEGLCEFARKSPKVATALARIEGWSTVVLQEVEVMENIQSEPLGGLPPETPSGGMSIGGLLDFKYLAAFRNAMADLNDEVDLSLEDLRDINEDMDTQQLLELHKPQHAKALEPSDENKGAFSSVLKDTGVSLGATSAATSSDMRPCPPPPPPAAAMELVTPAGDEQVSQGSS